MLTLILVVLSVTSLLVPHLPQSKIHRKPSPLAHPAAFWVLSVAAGLAASFDPQPRPALIGLIFMLIVTPLNAVWIILKGVVDAVRRQKWLILARRLRFAGGSVLLWFIVFGVFVVTMPEGEVDALFERPPPTVVLDAATVTGESAPATEVASEAEVVAEALATEGQVVSSKQSGIETKEPEQPTAEVEAGTAEPNSQETEKPEKLPRVTQPKAEQLIVTQAEPDEQAIVSVAEGKPETSDERPVEPEAVTTNSVWRETAEGTVEQAEPATGELDPATQTIVDALGPLETNTATEPSREPELVTFTIEAHPIPAEIHARTRIGEPLKYIGHGTATLTVPVGTRITYEVDPGENNGYDDFKGSVVAEADATHPVWLNPAPIRVLPIPNAYELNTPNREVAEFFLAYANEDWWGMVDHSCPGTDREYAYSWLEGTYFFRPLKNLISIRTAENRGLAARVDVVWDHNLGRSQVRLVLTRDDPSGRPTPNAPWCVNYMSALKVQDAN